MFCGCCLFVYFFLFSELPGPTDVKLCHMIGKVFNFIIQGPPRPLPKNLGTKNVQN